MGKKAVLFFVLIVVVFCTCANMACAQNDSSNIIAKLSEFSTEEIESMLILLKPMLVSDSGIDTLILLIENNKEGDSGYVGKLLGYIDKTSALNGLLRIKSVDVAVREKFLSILENKEEEKVSQNSEETINYFLGKAYEKQPKLEMFFTKNGINANVFASFLKACAEINNNEPMLTDLYDNNEMFAVHTATDEAVTLFNDDWLNTALESNEKKQLKTLCKELGLYTEFINVMQDASGICYTDDELDVTFLYNIVPSSNIEFNYGLKGASVIEISTPENGNVKEFETKGKQYIIKIPVVSQNVMAYRLGSVLEPIKYSVCDGEYIYIKMDTPGYYGIGYPVKYFSDSDGWGSQYIESLHKRGIINGVADKLFAPENNITREEFVKLIVELFDFDDDTFYAPFSDVSGEDWFYRYIGVAYKNGIIDGIGQNLFGTGQFVTREDICKIIANAATKRKLVFGIGTEKTFSDDENISEYARESVKLMQGAGVVEGDENGFFNPSNYATRQEAAKIIFKILEFYIKNAS
ncbi:MAG: S-layer homology domain-containing protein [Firmicutes bacterium]|nr:S-layer homology domain-containing protein [Bacillota bacterium]